MSAPSVKYQPCVIEIIVVVSVNKILCNKSLN